MEASSSTLSQERPNALIGAPKKPSIPESPVFSEDDFPDGDEDEILDDTDPDDEDGCDVDNSDDDPTIE